MATKTKKGLKTAAVRDYQNENPNASASEVVAALKKQGIKISQATVYNVRSNSKKSPAKPERKPEAATAANNGAVEHGGKSQIVRAAVRELGRKTPTKEIIDHLAAKGIGVSVALVAKVKSRMKPGRKSRPATTVEVPVAPAAAAAPTSDNAFFEHLLAAKQLADQFGGTDSLRRTLDVLDKLR